MQGNEYTDSWSLVNFFINQKVFRLVYVEQKKLTEKPESMQIHFYTSRLSIIEIKVLGVYEIKKTF